MNWRRQPQQTWFVYLLFAVLRVWLDPQRGHCMTFDPKHTLIMQRPIFRYLFELALQSATIAKLNLSPQFCKLPNVPFALAGPPRHVKHSDLNECQTNQCYCNSCYQWRKDLTSQMQKRLKIIGMNDPKAHPQNQCERLLGFYLALKRS
jgi:hypothetical protein